MNGQWFSDKVWMPLDIDIKCCKYIHVLISLLGSTCSSKDFNYDFDTCNCESHVMVIYVMNVRKTFMLDGE